ncbi:MAG: hypothetical protein QM790_05625 [Nibricoccus sp.]
MNTTIDLFLDFTPCDLYRLGNSSSPKLDAVRTSPPRAKDERVDIESYTGPDGAQWIDAKTGGVSLFDQRIIRMGRQWYRLPANTQIPTGLVISKDAGAAAPGDAVHYTVRPVKNMPLAHYIALLRMLIPFAQPAFFGIALPTPK